MQNVFFNKDVLAAERKICSDLKIPPVILMENAGANSAGYVISNFPDCLHCEIAIITGKGNNAGDGFVIARHLANHGVNVKIITLYREKELSDDALLNYNILKNYSTELISIVYCKDDKDLRKEISIDNRIIIDAIFGVGFNGAPDSRFIKIFECINSLIDKTVISVDVPSGFYSYCQDTEFIKADVTLMMGVKKFDSLFYKGKENSGRIEVMDIGISRDKFTEYNKENIIETEVRDVMQFLTSTIRGVTANKYSSGKVFILAGSPGLTGAAYLCSESAIRTGSGAVILGVPESINEVMEVKLTEVMTLPLKQTENKTLSLHCYDDIQKRLLWADCVLIGPGISKDEETMELVRTVVKRNNIAFIIDADAIAAFANNLHMLKGKNIILTPHFGEFANLTGTTSEDVKENFYEMAKRFAKDYKVILVLKNSPTIISDQKSFYINSTGRENLATAGCGDVLSGIIAGLYSQTKNPTGSAVSGVYIHGLCGDRLYDRSGSDSTIAGDLIGEIAMVKTGLRRN
jgi:NAD(P)H-hydrate epimerase